MKKDDFFENFRNLLEKNMEIVIHVCYNMRRLEICMCKEDV